MPSLTIENYVKAIYLVVLRQEGRPATTGQLAQSLGVLPGTVTSMLKTLAESGLAAYTPYEGVSLTDAGRSLALRIVRRHRLVELFLARTLEMPWDEVHEEAEHMEHAVSDHLIDRIDAFLGHPATDPHGDPIPKADGTVAPTEGQPLADWPPDVPFRLVRVTNQEPAFLRELSDAGITLGVTGRLGRVDSASEVELALAGGKLRLPLDSARQMLVSEAE